MEKATSKSKFLMTAKIVIWGVLAFLPMQIFAQSVDFKNSWIEYDAIDNNETGMKFHFSFIVHNCNEQELQALVFPYDSNGNWLTSYNNAYSSTTGSVCTSRLLHPIFEHSSWSDMELFIPYSAMPIAKKGMTYKYCLVIRKQDNTQLGMSQGWNLDWASHSPNASISNLHVDYQASKDNKNGMLILTDIFVNNDIGNDIELCCFFYDTQGNSIKSTYEGYHSTTNDLSTWMYKKADSKYTFWDNVSLFIPYSAFPNKEKTYYSFRYYVRDKQRNYEILASSEKQSFYVINNEKDDCNKPVIEWLSSYESSSSVFVAKAGIRSQSEIIQAGFSAKKDPNRGMKAIKNDGNQMTIQENIVLTEGANEIVISATNTCGTTTKTVTVNYTKEIIHNNLTENRIALVIGNAMYPDHPLSNPANDANDISASLRNLGFDVQTVINGTKRQIDEAVTQLRQRSGPNTVALFYYAGHGIQKDGRNYLIPVDAVMHDASDIEYACNDVNRILSNMESSGCRQNILVLDACRDNPFERSWNRGQSSRGLTSLDAPDGTFIAYATSPGRIALDGQSRNSPYADAFLKTLNTPGLAIYDFFLQVHALVKKNTKEAQIPWISSSFVGKFYFNQNK